MARRYPTEWQEDPSMVMRLADEKPVLDYKPPGNDIVVVHEDTDVLIVEKPAGLLTVPGKRDGLSDCLQSRVNDVFPDARLIHRLDLETSGLVIFARNKSAQRHLGLQFERRHVRKHYEALVYGTFPVPSATVYMPIRCDWPNRPLQMVDYELGRNAQTQIIRVSIAEKYTRLSLSPHTGRSHQLRVHCSALGHPIVGDRFYAPQHEVVAGQRMMLHARKLEFRHPVGGASVTVESPMPF